MRHALALALAGGLSLTLVPRTALAHCDTLDGPVVKDARAALDAKDVTPVLKWVGADKEGEIREAFQHALEEMGGEEEGYAEPLDQEGVAFARRLLSGYKAHQEEVDRVLEETVEGWDFRQMAKTDLAVLRLAVYEMLYEPTPFEPLIEVAVKIANRYGGEHSGSFVNGVLARVYRRVAAGELKTVAKEA